MIITDISQACHAIEQSPVILFDFNGTLSLDEDLYTELYLDAARTILSLEITPEDYDEHYIGHNDFEIARDLAHRAGHDDLTQAVMDSVTEQYLIAISKSPRIPASHQDFVKHLVSDGKRLGIVTGTFRKLLEAALRSTGIAEYFSITITAEDVTHGKPHPESFITALQQFEIAASECVGFEDSEAGLAGLNAAGIPANHVGDGSISMDEVARSYLR